MHGRSESPDNGLAASSEPERQMECIADRFLRFDRRIVSMPEGHVVLVDVMTDASGEERKLCTLTITLEQLVKVIQRFEIK